MPTTKEQAATAAVEVLAVSDSGPYSGPFERHARHCVGADYSGVDSPDRRFYCVAPSCPHTAEAGSQFCAVHNGRQVAWYSVTRPDGSHVNVRAESEVAAQRVANR